MEYWESSSYTQAVKRRGLILGLRPVRLVCLLEIEVATEKFFWLLLKFYGLELDNKGKIIEIREK